MIECSLLGIANPSPKPQSHPLAIKVQAGMSQFPSPARDYEQKELDLNSKFITNPPATFVFQVAGDSMTGAGIFPGDYLIVDRSISPSSGSIVVVDVDGQWMVKRLKLLKNGVRLLSENTLHEPITLQEGQELIVFGVVTYSIHKPE